MSRLSAQWSNTRHAVMVGMLACSLTGCVGGPIAQQVASSLLMRAADKVTSDAYDNYLLNDTGNSSSATSANLIPGHGNTYATASSATPQMDEYWAAFLNTGFTEIKPSAEPLPAHASNTAEINNHAISASALVTVEVWNLLLGEEKTTVLEKARLRGNDISQLEALAQWQVAIGALASSPQSTVTILIPPEFGRINSGQELLVEVSEHSDLHIARYRLEPQRAFKQASGKGIFTQP